jgi:hypothetical protein
VRFRLDGLGHFALEVSDGVGQQWCSRLTAGYLDAVKLGVSAGKPQSDLFLILAQDVGRGVPGVENGSLRARTAIGTEKGCWWG